MILIFLLLGLGEGWQPTLLQTSLSVTADIPAREQFATGWLRHS